jgi:hypothetical protein
MELCRVSFKGGKKIRMKNHAARPQGSWKNVRLCDNMRICYCVILNLFQNLIVLASYNLTRSRNKFGMTIVRQPARLQKITGSKLTTKNTESKNFMR